MSTAPTNPPSVDIPTTDAAPDPNNSNSSNSNHHPLLRDESVGMNPVTLVTGFYGPRGERIRHVVHEGALRLPAPALDQMIVTSETTANTDTTHNPVVLPECDAVQRPSLQQQQQQSPPPLVVVTEVYQKETVQDDISPVDGTIRTTTLSQTIIQNVNLTPPPVPVSVAAVVVGSSSSGDQESSKNNSVTPMDVDPVVVCLQTKSAPPTTTSSTTTPSTTTAAAASVPTNVPATTVSSSTLQIPPADPNLQPQQISNMEQALLLSATTVPSTSTNSSSRTNGTAVVVVSTNPTPTTTVPSSSVAVVDAPTVAKIVTSPPSLPTPTGLVIPLTRPPCPTPPLVSTTTATIHPGPTWYQSDRVAALERAVLSEWFDGSAAHRTEASYIEARERILALATTMPDQYVTGTMVRRTVAGDAGSLLRLHAFLTSHQMINRNAINESTPPPMLLLTAKPNRHKRAKISTNDWDDVMKWNVMQAVVEQSRTNRTPADHDPDWSAVAKSVGQGVTAAECEHLFRTMSIPTVHPKSDDHPPVVQDGSVTPDVVASVSTSGTDPITTTTKSKMPPQDWITDLVNDVDPDLRRAVTMAALSHTAGNNKNDLAQQQQQQVPKAAVLGLIVRDAMDTAQEQEERVVEILSEVMELRMQRIESRLSTLDDVEDMLEAERVALELERRDLYTARCRHWFGGT